MSLLKNKCPRCEGGEIYAAFLRMNKSCGRCGWVYEREAGFFTGAMFLDCVFLPVSAIPFVLVFALKGEALAGGVAAVLEMLLIFPFVFRASRILWIRADYLINYKK
jgi:uncharacterized protein (DUF983 family)